MPCSSCLREKPIVARGYCGACYQRWQRHGSPERRRQIGRSICSVGGCDKPLISHGLCDMHRRRMKRHDDLSATRPDDWGAKEKHPLYNTWSRLCRYRGRQPIASEWEADFLQFVMDIGERPSPKHKLFAADDSRPIGRDNFVWKRAITEKVVGEDEKTYQARVHRVYRSVREEAFRGYDLKRRYGLSKVEFDEMRDAQDHRCAICQHEETNIIRGQKLTLAVDHCHSTGKVRALLCAKCNRALGLMREKPDLLRAAAEYLERHAKVA